MFSNVASSFITGVVSPIPPFSTDDEGNQRDSMGSGPHDSVTSNEEGVANHIKSLCESFFSMSATSVNGSHTFHHHSNLTAHHNEDTSVGSGGSSGSGTSWEEESPSAWSFGKDLSKSNNNSNYHHHNHPRHQGYHSGGSASGVTNYNGLTRGGELSSLSSDSNYDGTFCPVDWDDILCWPRTAAGEVAQLPCFDTFKGVAYNTSGIAERLCLEDGIWNKTEYSGCKPYHQVPNITTDTGNLAITTGIYLFGYSVSLIALIIAAVIFISFKELRCLRNTIHSHLMVTYVLADALWVLGVVSAGSSDQGSKDKERHTTHATCITFVLLHYFHLTNFFWMFVEGLYLYVLVVQTFMTESIRLRTYCLIGWGLPFLIVLLWSISKWATMSIKSGGATGKMIQMAELEFNAVVCPWIHANQYDWIYIASALIVLAANLVFLLQIMWVLITKLRSATSQETQQSRKAAKALVVLMPLLGITYVLFLINPKKWSAFEHTRAFLLSTQGFLVSLLYCFLNAEVRSAIRHRWNRMGGFGPDFKCCCCCDSSAQNNVQNLRDWSPRSRTESIRLYTPTNQNYRKRESSASDATTITAVGGTGSFNGSGHVHAVTTMAGNGNTTLITTMTGRRISTTPLHSSCRPTTTFIEEQMESAMV
ncbi:unnamed protein product [Orchesella dallaii]|uniref:Diuretic hormone receptor n=1 Tax=Orchesella dallaii TaxID=48710 RepID=A0ABP1RSW4_9HEXA